MKMRLLLVADQNMWHRSLDKLFEAPILNFFNFATIYFPTEIPLDALKVETWKLKVTIFSAFNE